MMAQNISMKYFTFKIEIREKPNRWQTNLTFAFYYCVQVFSFIKNKYFDINHK